MGAMDWSFHSFHCFQQPGEKHSCFDELFISVTFFFKNPIYCREGQQFLNPLSSDAKLIFSFSDLHMFLMELVRRICLNIKTSDPWLSLSLLISISHLKSSLCSLFRENKIAPQVEILCLKASRTICCAWIFWLLCFVSKPTVKFLSSVSTAGILLCVGPLLLSFIIQCWVRNVDFFYN